MKSKVIFTICAKNYLAQALSLKESALKHNENLDFFIFLADLPYADNLPDVIHLDDCWIPNWKQMAFKYDVIEFNTSIKPFCIDYLFKKGYDNVVYLDPDIYVFNSLDYVFDNLGKYSIILTPHRCYPTTSDDYISDTSVSNVGIYNLGFIALNNDTISNQVVNWWKNKLANQCYVDVENGLFVDQKWMDFIPGFFPDNILISRHLGLNFAAWNLQERQLYFEGEVAKVKDILTQRNVYDLLFLHFSGFSPLTPERLDKRGDVITIKTNPELINLINEYKDAEINNNYAYYSSLSYSFNAFSNNRIINPLIRRSFRTHEDEWSKYKNPFDENGYIYKYLNTRHLISKQTLSKTQHKVGIDKFKQKKGKVIGNMRFLLRLIGVEKYLIFMKVAKKIGDIDLNSKYLAD